MASLFLDSTYDITLGVLNDDLGWNSFNRFFGQRASNVIQKEAHRLLTENLLSAMELTSVISVAGPGFYTGLRLSEGFADVLSFSGIKHYSFLSYDIPRLIGVESGVWMTKAYRGEYFFHHWDSTSSNNTLVSSKDLSTYLNKIDKGSIFVHSSNAIDDLCKMNLNGWNETISMLEKNPEKIFAEILKSKSKIESFYFRPPEDEFKVSI